MYCSQCGNELKDNEKICSKCGNTIKENKFQALFKKVKDTGADLYNSIVPKVPILEIEYNKEIEELLLSIGFQWAHSKINGYRLRMYKYYTDGIYIAKMEIETFKDKLADVYIKLNYKESGILGQIIYDIMRLRNYIYVRYTGTNERTKLVEFCNLNDVVYKNGENKKCISPAWFEIIMNQENYNKLEKDGYINCSNNQKSIVLKKKEELEIYAYFKSKQELDLSKDLITKIDIAPFNSNYDNNLIAFNIIEFLKLSNIMRVEILEYKDDYSFTHKNISFYEFCSNLNFDFEMIGEYYYEAHKNDKQVFIKAIGKMSTPPEYYKDMIRKDRKYCKEHECNKRMKRL